MITLCGFALSNYYNKVKMVLLEKGVPFVEERVKTGSKDESVLSCSPLGKVPFIRTEHGAMCESQAIVDYIEATHPNPPLVPADPWQAAKVRELLTFIDLHIELVTRELYPKAFFAGEVSESNAARTRKLLERNLAAFKRLAKFSPYVAGDSFPQAAAAARAAQERPARPLPDGSGWARERSRSCARSRGVGCAGCARRAGSPARRRTDSAYRASARATRGWAAGSESWRAGTACR